MWNQEKMTQRIIRYKDLIPCKNAFVDTRSPGSDRKENFTLIGPGVAENPNQHIHIKEAHGFNIGGARQPAGCLNSQHSHLTAEVFVAHSGRWRMKFGVNGDEGSVELGVGDIISIPTNMFRGFENIGGDVGFLFAVLGRDNPGKVTWSPQVFELAKKYGLILLKGGRLIDTTLGEEVPQGAEIESPMGPQEIAKLATPPVEKLNRCVVRYQDLKPNLSSPLAGEGVEEAGVITPSRSGDGFTEEGIVPWWEHEFHLRRLSIDSGKATSWHSRQEEEVVFVQEGELNIHWREKLSGGEEGCLHLGLGDTLTIPKGMARSFSNPGKTPTRAFVVRGGLSPARPQVA